MGCLHDNLAEAVGVADLRAFLLGSWELSRAIQDRRGGRNGRLEGRAVFAPAVDPGDDALAYREEGCLLLGGFETLASQVYRYAFPAPHLAEVRFADGRAFHDLDLSAGVWTAEHRCGDDLYRGRFRVEGPERWRALWRVTGPRKDQRLDGLYRRETRSTT